MYNKYYNSHYFYGFQNVLRTWYARDPEIVATEDGLVETAHKCMTAFGEGELSVGISLVEG